MTTYTSFGGRERRVFDLLKSKPNKVISHLTIMEAMYGKMTADLNYRLIERCIANLRRYLKGTPYEGRISNIRKVGFILDIPEETKAAA